jgi:hypothetical protein
VVARKHSPFSHYARQLLELDDRTRATAPARRSSGGRPKLKYKRDQDEWLVLQMRRLLISGWPLDDPPAPGVERGLTRDTARPDLSREWARHPGGSLEPGLGACTFLAGEARRRWGRKIGRDGVEKLWRAYMRLQSPGIRRLLRPNAMRKAGPPLSFGEWPHLSDAPEPVRPRLVKPPISLSFG